ncbi:hypothetical protein FBU30_010397 [Linnemannia zychae]|nr:hypothetical protein FBU30_010397 [Linnemannia zychae]
MASATTRFFAIAEMVTHLIKFLDRGSILELIRTSQRMNKLCIPTLYFSINSEESAALLRTLETIKMLARNTTHIRELSLGPLEIPYYICCVLAHSDVETDNSNWQHHNSQQKLPLWFATPDPHGCTVYPIPPVTQLTKLKLSYSDDADVEACSYLHPSYRDPKAIITHICWIIDSNPHLLSLKLEGLIIKDYRDVRLLATSISKLYKLQKLSINVIRWQLNSSYIPSVGIDFFFACPSTLKSLRLISTQDQVVDSRVFTEEYINTLPGTLHSWERSDVECGLIATPRRLEPLVNLKILSLGGLAEYPTESDFRLLIQHCPNLVDIEIPYIHGIGDISRLARDLAICCPGLQILSNFGFSGGGNGIKGLLVRTLEKLPPQQVTLFNCKGGSGPTFTAPGLGGTDGPGSIFKRHSTTLRFLSFGSCQDIGTKAIQTILTQCEALEHLNVIYSGGSDQNLQCIHLDDAVLFPWACNKIQNLTLTIAIPEQPFHRIEEDTVPYYNRSLPTLLSTEEKVQFKYLEVFYRQIGVLTELVKLDLRAIFFDPENIHPASTYFMTNTFPGMLSLGCEESGRVGYLHLLGGLSKLRILNGSVSVTTGESRVTVGMEEVKWMNKHWSSLMTTSFFQCWWLKDSLENLRPYEWLREQRPGIIF